MDQNEMNAYLMDQILTLNGQMQANRIAIVNISHAIGAIDPNVQARLRSILANAADDMDAEEDGEIAVQEALYELQSML